MSLLSTTSFPILPTNPSSPPSKNPSPLTWHRYPTISNRLSSSSTRLTKPHPPTRHSTTPPCSSSMHSQISPSLPQLEGCLEYSRAFWVSRSLIAWNVDVGDGSCFLYSSWNAGLVVNNNGVEGYDGKIELESENGMLPASVIEKFPHIRDYRVLKVPHTVDAKSLLKCQLAIAHFEVDGVCNNVTGLQLPGVLDELYSYNGPLGAIFSTDAVSLYLWAPTAQAVSACLYRDPSGGDPLETFPLKELNGVWSAKGPTSWEGCYYVYQVSVYHPSTLRVETCMANDPYARGISPDCKRTLLVNLDCDNLKPKGWDNLADEKPELSSFSDISIYELHVRDFSTNDHTVNPEFGGGYLAFTSEVSAGILHLKKLRDAGLTHVHLLPTFQFAGVDDEKEKWKSVGEIPFLP